jgi:hypothetical protein
MGPCCHGGQFKINEMHMVAEHHIRGLQIFRADLLHLEFLTDQGALGQNPDQPCPEFPLMKGISGGFIALFVFVIHFNIHISTLLGAIVNDSQIKGKKILFIRPNLAFFQYIDIIEIGLAGIIGGKCYEH